MLHLHFIGINLTHRSNKAPPHQQPPDRVTTPASGCVADALPPCVMLESVTDVGVPVAVAGVPVAAVLLAVTVVLMTVAVMLVTSLIVELIIGVSTPYQPDAL